MEEKRVISKVHAHKTEILLTFLFRSDTATMSILVYTVCFISLAEYTVYTVLHTGW